MFSEIKEVKTSERITDNTNKRWEYADLYNMTLEEGRDFFKFLWNDKEEES